MAPDGEVASDDPVVAALVFIRHALLPGRTYRLALVADDAAIGDETATYDDVVGELATPGYTLGGAPLVSHTAEASGAIALLAFSDPGWDGAPLVARGGVLYDASDPTRPVAVVFRFGADRLIAGAPFRVQLPTPGSDALVRVSPAA